jgi:hypothetical protein
VSATITLTQQEAKLTWIHSSFLPESIKKTIASRNATGDLAIFKITYPPQDNEAMITITIKELFKRRKDPFPAKIEIRDEHSVKFVDGKYFLSVYPTKAQRVTYNHNSGNVM